jgi:PAS domain S-box-containing protein
MTNRLLGFEATEKLFESGRTSVWRGQRRTSAEPVVLKLLKPEVATGSELARFRQEYLVTSKASGASGVVRAFALEEALASLLMVLEDIGGTSLDRQPLPLSLKQFLELAIGLADTVAQLHQRRIIHKDINPSNIAFNPRTGQHRLFDFGVADELPLREVAPRPPAALEGTLAYISPEQTGRMNRPVDYRTDFYSLGVTFYQLLTGRLPFEAKDALGLVHCHIAAPPAAPHRVDSRIPPSVSRIILKLMSKMAEDRYQSGFGLRADLERCLGQSRDAGAPEFELGQDDFTDRLQPPQKLIGRGEETARLLAALDRAEAAGPELVLVAGYPGVGKTSLVREIHKPVLERRGSFVEGKFDQLQRNVPYSGWIRALEGLVTYLLMESESELARWKQGLLAAVGGSGRVLTDVIRNLALIIGPQPEVPELGGAEAENRFNYLFLRLLQTIAREHPLVVFLDDLQWIDPASLRLLRAVLASRVAASILVVGAYRDNEVGPLHPLPQAIETLLREQAKVDQLQLGNLTERTVNELVAGALREGGSSTAALAHLIHLKTRGNAFFTIEMLRSLVERRAIAFDFEARCWRWDIRALDRMEISDNVVALMLLEIRALEPRARRLLPLAACAGFRFGLETLATIAREPEDVVQEGLDPALREGLIVPAEAAYQFIHDRVQQAAYALIPRAERKKVHLEIGRLLLQRSPAHDHEAEFFASVDHLNIGAELLETREERLELAQLNLRAGQRARASAAFSAAAQYFDAGVALLDEESWKAHPELALELNTLAAEGASLTGHFKRCDQLFAAVTRRSKNPVDTAGVYQSKMTSYLSQGRLQEALDVALEILGRLGSSLPSHPTADDVRREMEETKSVAAKVPAEELLKLPEMTDPTKLAIARIASKANAAAYIGRPNLHLILVLNEVRLCVKYGNTLESPYFYAAYGLILCGMERDLEAGFRFGNLALALLESADCSPYRSKTLEVVCAHVWHFSQHLRTTLPYLEAGHQSGLEVGDLEYAGYNAFFLCCHSYFAGMELRQVEQAMDSYGEALKRIRAETAYPVLATFGQAVKNLLSPSGDPCSLAGDRFQEAEMLPILERTHHAAALAAFSVNRLALCYLFGRDEEALASAEMAEMNKGGMLGMFSHSVAIFYDSLARLRLCSRSEAPRRARLLEKVSENLRELKHLADHAPANQLHRVHLVEAERMRVLGQDMSALDHYDRAILLARENEYLQEEALANELAGRFWLGRGKDDFARLHLQRARDGYARWQAFAKVKALEDEYPQWLAPSAAPYPPPALGALDVGTLTKAAQAISSEMELGRLLGAVTRILIECAGAQSGSLLLEQDGRWRVATRGEIGRGEVETSQPAGMDESGLVSPSVVRLVARTREWVVLDEAASQGQFANDPLIQRKKTRSLFCAPLLSRGRLMGVFYLENNLVAGAFTRDRVDLLTMLLAQAATSLENARTYEALRASEAKYRRIVDTTSEGVWGLDADARTTFVNARVAEMLGYTSREMLGRPLSDFLFEMELPDHRRRMESRNRGVSESYERRLRRKDGKAIWAHISATPTLDEAGRFLGAFAMLTDITERKRAQQDHERLLVAERAARHGAELAMRRLAALQRVTEAAVGGLELDELLGELLDRVVEGMQTDTAAILLVSADGAWLEARAAHGLEEEERGLRLPLGRGFAGRVVSEARTIRIYDIDRAEVLNPLLRAKGVRSLLGAPLLAAGRAIGVLHVGTLRSHCFDDDEERWLQAVAERVATAIERVRLQEAAERARAEAKVARRFAEVAEDFARMVSHDLRAPLQIISVQAQALERGLGREELPRLAGRTRAIVSSGQRMNSMLVDLAETARLESGQVRLARRPVALGPFLANLVERLGAVFDRQRIALEVPDGLPLADADPDRLERIVTNLVSNAFKYGGDDSPVTIAGRELGEWIEVSVADRGPGIPEDLLPRLFGRFARGGAKPGIEGLGLGLYITRLLVEAHGGHIWARSRPAQGCSVTFTLAKASWPYPGQGSEAAFPNGP